MAEKAKLDAVVNWLSGFLNGLSMLPKSCFTAHHGVDDTGVNTVSVRSPGAMGCCTVERKGHVCEHEAKLPVEQRDNYFGFFGTALGGLACFLRTSMAAAAPFQPPVMTRSPSSTL